MGTASLVIGVVVLIGVGIGFIPCLGWLNWFNIPLALIGIAVGVAGLLTSSGPEGEQGRAIGGLILSGLALVMGGVRLLMGGGLF